ncbi:hypothetical protein AVEN_131276-1 [Araneus ventricosus]|uniref:Uncharacterized protein n=1 Tax=Araneus ventricosus TaxID=182803 RepID=A0A4Y2BX85_ARAVE|nr:hypothetical protein AVEN_131276-1 [Araneus ventricosus]
MPPPKRDSSCTAFGLIDVYKLTNIWQQIYRWCIFRVPNIENFFKKANLVSLSYNHVYSSHVRLYPVCVHPVCFRCKTFITLLWCSNVRFKMKETRLQAKSFIGISTNIFKFSQVVSHSTQRETHIYQVVPPSSARNRTPQAATVQSKRNPTSLLLSPKSLCPSFAPKFTGTPRFNALK